MEPDQATALIVLGAHRSGTSSLAGTAAYLGGTLPKNVMGATESNPKGHFEPTDIASLHDLLLFRAGSSWHDTARFPQEWYSSLGFKKFSGALAEAYRDNYGDAPLTVLKDPRINRLIPLWEDVLKQLNTSPRVVIISRNPIEVAQSLHARDHFPLPLGLLIWLRNQLDAEYFTRHMQRTFVNYDDLITNWRSAISKIETQLDITFPDRSALAQSNVDDFLETSLRHHNLSPGQGSTGVVITDWAQDAFSIMSSEERVLSASGRATLDRIRMELDSATQAFSPLVEGQQRHVFDLRQQLDACRGVAPPLRKNAEDAEIVRLDEDRAAIKEAYQGQGLELAHQLAEPNLKHAEREAEIVRLAAELSALSDEFSAMSASTSWRPTDGLPRLTGDRQKHEHETTTMKVRSPASSDLSGDSDAPDQAPTQDPRILFDVHYYLERYSDVRTSSMDPWEHYTRFGIHEGRNPNPLFDTAWYLEQNPAVSSAGENPLTHYLTRGAAEGLSPSPEFDGDWYLLQNPDVVAAGMNPLVHYLGHGRAEGRLPKGPDPDPATRQRPDGH